MGSPLAPLLANFLMGHYERHWLEKYTGTQLSYYRRYVDDIICCFQNSHDVDMFFQYLNKCHPNIKFTMETLRNRWQITFFRCIIIQAEIK